MNSTRLFCLVLALVLTLGACSSTPNSKETNVSETTDTTDSTETTEPEETGYTPNIPEIYFDNEDFNVLGVQTSTQTITFHVEEDSADIYNSALFKRNLHVEETYGVTFNYETVNDYNATKPVFVNCVLSDTVDYDFTMLICRDAFAVAQEGYVYPVENIPYLDFDAPWYFQNINDQFSIGGKLFYAYSAECLNAFSQTTAVYFNKAVVEIHQLPDLYETVYNGEWTIDKMIELASIVKSPERLGNDTVYGISTAFDMFYPTMWVGADVRLVEKNEEDIPEFTLTTNEKAINILEKCLKLKKETNMVYDALRDLAGAEGGLKIFTKDKALFRITSIGDIVNFRDMESDFGILPSPKYDESQTNYIGRMFDGWINLVPVNTQKIEMTGVVMEALAAEAMNTTVPAYFDVILDYQVVRDQEAADMLDIIYNNLTIDLGDTIWAAQIRYPVVMEIVNGTGSFASAAKKIDKSMNKEIKDAISAIDKYLD